MSDGKKFGKNWTMIVFEEPDDDPGHCAACQFSFENLNEVQFAVIEVCLGCGRSIVFIEPEEVCDSSSCW